MKENYVIIEIFNNYKNDFVILVKYNIYIYK